MQLGMGAVSKITTASRRQLTYWHETGLLKPSGKATGHRRYTFPDIVAAKTIVALRQQGCSLQRIRKAVSYLRRHYPKDASAAVLSSLTLLTDGKAVYMLTDSDAIMEVVSSRAYELTIAVVMTLGMLLIASTLMFFAEGTEQPEKFGSIPRALWWSVVTMTTVGYGDTVPETLAGKILGGIVQLTSIAVVAVPTGIFAAAFVDVMGKRRTKRGSTPREEPGEDGL